MAIKFLICSVFLLVTAVLGWKEVRHQGANWLPIKYVRIEGAFQYIAKNKIKKVLQGQVNNGLYNTNIQVIQQSVAFLPWVESVKVERVWPDTIDIKITEQIPIARWGLTDLVNKKGELFRPVNMDKFEVLPIVSGNTGNEKRLLEIMKGLTLVLSDQNMELTEFRVSNWSAWYIKLKNGIELKLGRDEPLKKLERFLQTLALIGKEQIAKIKVVDLRYPNGYAMAWKALEEQIDWKSIADKNREIAY